MTPKEEAQVIESLMLGLSEKEVGILFHLDIAEIKPLAEKTFIVRKLEMLKLQWDSAKNGDPAILKHLGKILLGQDDTQHVELKAIPYQELTRAELLEKFKELTDESHD